MGLRSAPFQQQFNIKTIAGSSILYGFGNIPRTKFSLQVTANDGTYPGNQPSSGFLNMGILGGALVAGATWDVALIGITDLLAGTGSVSGMASSLPPLIDHNSGTEANGQVKSIEGPPIDSIQVFWSGVNLGTANNLLVTITADE